MTARSVPASPEAVAVGRDLVAPDGTALLIRPSVPADAVALADLYRRLPAAEWVAHLGVCDGHDRGFAARAVAVAVEGGRGLVVEAGVPVPADQQGATLGDLTGVEAGPIVGEAHYELLPGGVADLTLVVAPEWRDWLGPRLFDAILEEAVAAGIVNAEVEVMNSDSWMLALISARSRVVVPTDDWLSTRLVLGADGSTPVWGTAPGPRVLVEAPDGHWHAAESARAAGLAVLVCTSPPGQDVGCPLAVGTPCRLASLADVVVVSYPPDRPEWDERLAAHRQLHPDTPLCVEGRLARDLPDGAVALDVHDPVEVVSRITDLAAARADARSGDARP